jgi:hypothetical protein
LCIEEEILHSLVLRKLITSSFRMTGFKGSDWGKEAARFAEKKFFVIYNL